MQAAIDADDAAVVVDVAEIAHAVVDDPALSDGPDRETGDSAGTISV